MSVAMQSFFLPYKSSLIHYEKTGNGDRLLLGFHGYSESTKAFNFLEGHIGDDLTMIIMDLPFHGKTTWKEGFIFTTAELIEIVEQIIKGSALQQSKICLLGFSMGGRVALSVLQIMPEKIEKIILLSPDGLKVNGWYWLATQNKLGNTLFRLTMQYPSWFLGMLRIANNTRLINQSVYKFATYYMQDKQVRDDLYCRWTTMRKFRNNLKKIKSCIVTNKISAKLLYGEYDRIILADDGKKFRKGIEEYCDLYILPCGHQVLHEKNLETIIHLLEKS